MNLARQLDTERRAISKLEANYLKNKAGQTYIACEDFDFIWTNEEVFDLECMWMEGASLEQMANHFKRTEAEVLILLIDRSSMKRLKPRKGGLFGVSD